MRKQILASVIVASVFLSASPAASQYAAYPDGREPAYNVTFYSDASRTTVVGYLTPQCTFTHVQYHLTGQHSYHSVDEFSHYCTQWGPE